MTQSNITALQTTLSYVTDSRDGYSKAAEAVKNTRFKQAFKARAVERQSMVDRLEAAIREAGGKPEEGGTILGTVHRNIMPVTSLVQDDEEAAIELVDDGEERLRAKIDEVCNDGQLAANEKMMLETIKRELEADARIIERMEEMVD